MTPFWLKLIRAHNRNGGLGLTLPFLIGACRSPIGQALGSEEQDKQDTVRLLSSIRDETPDSIKISLMICPRIHQPVFSEYYWPAQTAWDAEISRSPEVRPSLSVSPEILPKSKNTVDDLIAVLWPRHREVIAKGYFSYCDGQYAPFSDQDLELIAEANKVDPEDD